MRLRLLVSYTGYADNPSRERPARARFSAIRRTHGRLSTR